MDAYQEKALGRVPEADLEAEAAAQHRIGTVAVYVLVIAALILDLLSILEFPVADIVAWIIEIPIIVYLYYTGASQYRQLAANLLAWLAEIIPILDILPLYLVGILIMIAIDRNETLSRIASTIPQPKSGGKLMTGGGAPGSNLSKNRLFGAASEKRLAQAKAVTDRIDRLKERVPGKLRTMVSGKLGDSPVTTQDAALPVGGKPRAGVDRSRRLGSGGSAGSYVNPQFDGAADQDAPFPDTYYNYERELLPELNDLVDIDVTGAQSVNLSGVAAPKPPVTKNTATQAPDAPPRNAERDLGLKP